MTKLGRAFAVFLAFLLAGQSAAMAQNVRIRNAWKTDQEINIETRVPQSSPAGPGWLSAQWVFEPVAGSKNVRIKNVWLGTYLNVETGKLQATPAGPGWLSAQWRLVGMSVAGTYRIENAWTGAALNVESGSLTASNAPMNWQSAIWRISGYSPAPAAPLNAASASVAETEVKPIQEIVAAPPKPAEIVATQETATTKTDCNDLNQIGQCLNENIAQPSSDFFTKTIPAPFKAGGAVANFFGNDPTKYQVQIDFCHPTLQATETAANITVEFWTTEGYVDKKIVAGTASDCGTFSKGVLNFYQTTGYNINQIQIKTDGQDAFFIDQVKVWKGTEQVLWEGRDGGNGWCLSTDRTAGSDWASNLAFDCVTTLIFKAP
jgi:hypothetical protein